ncbi:hypothetical protein [Caulobacter segnis]|nr:hypothetical protein [Caulobacter segnis]UAL11223.1 hypothetical protein K8940_02670 [Caulobacter segnis]
MRSVPATAKAEPNTVFLFGAAPMLAILVIAVFLGVILVLNAVEFGRID